MNNVLFKVKVKGMGLKSSRIDLNKRLYAGIYLIRKAEELIIKHYPDNGMKTPMHMSMGQEAIPVGVCEALGSQGQAVGTYRSHALFLAKTGGDTKTFFGEMYGKVSGVARGKAGSMHLSSPEHGLLCVSAVVASTVPEAVGMAFANKMRGEDRLVAAFFGDGAMDAGVFWESFNFACLKELPVLFVCEDNGFAVNVPDKSRQGFDSTIDLVRQYRCFADEADTTDVEEVYDTTLRTLGLIKEECLPGFLRFGCYRYLVHVGVKEDFNLGYRSKEDFLRWFARDPIAVQRMKLLKLGVGEDEVVAIERELDAKAESDISSAITEDFPSQAELYRGVFHGE